MKEPLNGPMQPGDNDRAKLTEEQMETILREALKNRDELARALAKSTRKNPEGEAMLIELDQVLADIERSNTAVELAEQAVLHANADLTDQANLANFVNVQFAIHLEKELPQVRELMTPEQLTQAEGLLKDWNDNRASWLETLTAEQRREIGYGLSEGGDSGATPGPIF